MKKLTTSIFAVAAMMAFASGAQAQSVADFYKGKTVTIYIAFSPGGTYDLFGRMVARHIGKHIPGNPTVIGSNMPGAGGLTATNFMFRSAPKDGTAMAIITQNIAIEEALKNKAVQYKSNEFNWIGRATSNIEIHVLSTKSPGHTIEGARKHETPVASTGPGSPSDSYPRLLNATLGTKFKVVRGYPGSTDGLLAIERGEMDGALTSWNTMKSTRMSWLTEGRAVLPVQYTMKRSPELKNVPTAVELMTNDADRKLMTFAISSAEVGRSFLAPPGVPADRVQALRTAFNATMKDPELLAEVEKAQLDFVPATGEELAKIIADTLAVDEATVERMRKITTVE
jgi:tripartite-type tricarboxylate transporter receptor subunit TctC